MLHLTTVRKIRAQKFRIPKRFSCLTRKQDTITDLRNSYVLRGPAQVEFRVGIECIYGQTSMLVRGNPAEIQTPAHQKPDPAAA